MAGVSLGEMMAAGDSATTWKAVAVAIQTPGREGLTGLPVLLWGPPGVGKTAMVNQIGARLGLHVETIMASLREPEDFLGLPVVVAGEVKRVPDRWAVVLHGLDAGILFLDELGTASDAVQAALLRVVDERMVGDLPLPPGVAVLAASNPAGMGAGKGVLVPALANRWIHLRAPEPDPNAWGDWLVGLDDDAARVRRTQVVAESRAEARPRKKNPAQEFPVLDREPGGAWARSWEHVRALGYTWPRARPDCFLNFPAEVKTRTQAWPSPRSWELALRGYAAGLAVGDDKVASLLLQGAVGAGVGGEFLTWTEALDLPDPEALLAGKVEWVPDPTRSDQARAVMMSVAAYLKRLPMDALPPLYLPSWGVIEALLDAGLSDLAHDGVLHLSRVRGWSLAMAKYPRATARLKPIFKLLEGVGGLPTTVRGGQ